MKQNRGMVLYIVVILLLLLTIIAIAAMNVGVLGERIARNRYGSAESLFAAESGALKVVACFSGEKNDLCKNTLALGTQERLSFLDNQTHDFFMANGKSTRFIAYPPKPAIVLPNPAQFVLPAAAVALPVAAWPRELETPDTPETLCPLHASCVTASVYPKVESNEANEGIGSDLGYAIVAGGTVTIEEGTAQSGGNQGGGAGTGGNQGGGNSGGNQGGGNQGGGTGGGAGGASLNMAPAPQVSALQQYRWLAALSSSNHRFDFPWLAQTNPPPPAPNNAQNNGNQGNGNQGGGNQGNGNQGGNQGGGSNNQNQQRVIAASIHAQGDIDLADVNVTGFATTGGQVAPASQVTVQVWDQGNCKDCFVDVENDFENFADRIKNYAETIKKTYPDRFQDNQGTFGSAQSGGNQGGGAGTGGNQGGGNSGGNQGGGNQGGGNQGQNPAPASPAPASSSGLQQYRWLAALSTNDHRFDFPWLAQTNPPPPAPNNAQNNGNQGNGNQGGGNANGNQGNNQGGGSNNQNQQAVEPQDLQGGVYYYDGDVTIYSNAAPVNGTIVATGDIIVEPFATGSGGALCPGDEPLVGQTVATTQALLQFGQVAIPWATSAASLAATVSAAAASTAATAGTGAVAAAPLSATQVLQFALQTLELAQSGTVALNQLCGLARSAVGTARGLLPSNGADSTTDSNGADSTSDSTVQTTGQNSAPENADSTTESPEQPASQNDIQESGAGGLLSGNSPQESFAPLNLIAGGNIELHRDLLGTMIAQGDITIGPEVMQIAYPSLPEEAPRIASWQRNYRLDKN